MLENKDEYIERLDLYNRSILKKGLTNDAKFIPNTLREQNESLTQLLRRYKGQSQQERMIRDKRRTLDKALLYSYQSAFVKNLERPEHEPATRALINPNKTKQDYDDKIISIGYEQQYQPGDIFRWEDTGTYWLIYLQDLTELAYFKGNIRKCSYQIAWEDEEGNLHKTYIALRGPVETKINYIQKNGISLDTPNHSLEILMPKNEDTVKYFTRYSKFYLQEDKSICWRVEAWDSLSMPGILQLNAVEYYANKDEDDLENGIAGSLIAEPIDPNPDNTGIKGETFIKPKIEYTYKYSGLGGNAWTIEPQGAPVKIVSTSGNSVTLKWLATYSGQFKLSCNGKSKTIVVQSLF